MWAHVALSIQWQIYFYIFQLYTGLLIGTCFFFVVFFELGCVNGDLCFTSHNGLLFVLGPAWAEGQDPCMPWIHQWCLARFLRKTDNMSFQWLCTSPDPAMTWRADQSAVQFKSSKSSQYRSSHEPNTDMWLQNQDKMHMHKRWLVRMRSSRWPVSMLECVRVRTDLPLLSGQADKEHFYIIMSHFSSSSPHLFSRHFAE